MLSASIIMMISASIIRESTRRSSWTCQSCQTWTPNLADHPHPRKNAQHRFSASKKIDQARDQPAGAVGPAQTCTKFWLMDVMLECRKEMLISLRGPPLQRDIDPNLLMLYDVSLPSLSMRVSPIRLGAGGEPRLGGVPATTQYHLLYIPHLYVLCCGGHSSHITHHCANTSTTKNTLLCGLVSEQQQ